MSDATEALLEARGVQVAIGGTPILHGAGLELRAGRARRGRRAQRSGQVDAGARGRRPAARRAAARFAGAGSEVRTLRGRRAGPDAGVRPAARPRAGRGDGPRRGDDRPLRRTSPARATTAHRPRRGRRARWSAPASTALRRAAADDALGRRAAARPDRGRPRAGGAGADRRRADLAPRPRRHRRRSRGCCGGWPTTGSASSLVVHDLALAAAIADTVVVMSRGPHGRRGQGTGRPRGRAPGRGVVRRCVAAPRSRWPCGPQRRVVAPRNRFGIR